MRPAIVCAVVLLCAACAEPKPTLDQLAPPEITIETVPRSATVTVDGADSGITPMVFKAQTRTGSKKLTFAHEGYLAAEITVKEEDVVAHSGQQVLIFMRPNTWDPKAKPIDPDNSTQLTRAGQDLSKANRCPEALPYLRHAIELDPRLPQPHKALGTCYARLKNTKAALEEYKAYLMYAPDAPDAAKVRAIVDQAQGDIDVGGAKED